MTDVITNCLFCKISRKEISANIRFENPFIIAFDDIHPKAPVHILLVPKKHIATLDDATQEDAPILGDLLIHAGELAKELGIADTGYRIIINTRHHGGQEIDHLHAHLLGGEPLGPMRSQK